MELADNYKKLIAEVPESVTIVAVSKFKPVEMILELYNGTGHRDYGESRAQELENKASQLPKDIRWHFIGHLQTNKIKSILPYVSLIHSVDSFKLLQEINKAASQNTIIVKVLLQFYIATEETKYGFSLAEVIQIIESEEFKEFNNIEVSGVMGMASYTDDESLIRKEFNTLHEYFQILKERYFSNSESFKEISMGMSGDYQLAIEEGSSMLRIGSLIFGGR
ncbi:MAG: YggS family pyridoxal phosphate-dependent enzyme [Bacteroidales bacterium]|nr:YggS family pyridoxal phosphate-dependent enzyme [Bacteroidales bacterium]